MNNFEMIKQMSVDELADFLTKNVHKVGKFYRKDLPRLDTLVFASGLREWLLEKGETMNEELNELIKERDENFIKLGQWQLQKMYYEDKIKNLLNHQEYLCHKIYGMMRDSEQ